MTSSLRRRAWHLVLGARERLARAMTPPPEPLLATLSRQALRRNWPMRFGLTAATLMAAALLARVATERTPTAGGAAFGQVAAALAILLLAAAAVAAACYAVRAARRAWLWLLETETLGAALASGALAPTPWPWQSA